ncbi:MAG: precorrin-6A synthase (deacetylating) [Solirubrobacteraceae bacterium]
MRRLLLIGIGTGDLDHVTVQAVAALNAFDVLFLVIKEGADELAAVRRRVLERHRTVGAYRTVELADPPRPWREAPDYREAVAHWRERRVELWGDAISTGLAAGETGAFLVWGDPSLYESTLAVVSEIADRGAVGTPDRAGTPARGTVGIDYEVIPGVSSIHALTARHRIPLNRVGGAVQITPARLLGGGMPPGVDDVVVMLDAGAAFATIPPAGIDIYWGAYLGTPDELLIRGRLGDVAEKIARVRKEAKERKGWIFDTYLLRRTG